MLSINQNIENNVELIENGTSQEYYLEVDSDKAISELMKGKNQIFIDEANAEAEHGIGKLSFLRLLKKEPKREKKGM